MEINLDMELMMGVQAQQSATAVGSDRDSRTTIAAFQHSQIEDRRPAYQMAFREMMPSTPN